MTDGAALRVIGSELCDQAGTCTCDPSLSGTHHPDCGWVPIADMGRVYAALAEVNPVGYWPVPDNDSNSQ